MGEDQELSNADIIANVEKLLQAERKAQNEQSKKGATIKNFDMNEGVVASITSDKARRPSLANTQGMEIAPDGGGELDVDIQKISRKKLDVKTDNINDIFMNNINVIAE